MPPSKSYLKSLLYSLVVLILLLGVLFLVFLIIKGVIAVGIKFYKNRDLLFATVSSYKKPKTIMIIVVLFVGFFLAYWFIGRPYYYTKQCQQQALKTISGKNLPGYGLVAGYDIIYKVCMRSHGLN